MHLTSRGYISIVELIIYTLCLILGFVVCLRHGFKRSSGWIFVVILSILRIAGSTCQLLTYNNPTEGLIKATLIFDSIGVAPLLLAVLGVLTRFVDWLRTSEKGPKFNPKLFRVLQLLIGVGLILGIIGITGGGSQSSDETFKPSTSSKAGIIVFIFDFAAITLIFTLSLSNVSALPQRERLIIFHIPLALLAIAVRILYSTLCIFVNNRTFSLFNGSVVADVLMAIVEEVFVVIMTIVVGFKLRRIDPTIEGENFGQQLPGSENGGYVKSSDSRLEMYSSA